MLFVSFDNLKISSSCCTSENTFKPKVCLDVFMFVSASHKTASFYFEKSSNICVVDPPQPLKNPLEQFGYIIGQPGEISITIEANPKPKIEWFVAEQNIKEGYSDSTGRIEAQPIIELVCTSFFFNDDKMNTHLTQISEPRPVPSEPPDGGSAKRRHGKRIHPCCSKPDGPSRIPRENLHES